MKVTYDRLEVIDILNHLLASDVTYGCMDRGSGFTEVNHAGIISEAEERYVHWFIKRGSQWYQIP